MTAISTRTAPRNGRLVRPSDSALAEIDSMIVRATAAGMGAPVTMGGARPRMETPAPAPNADHEDRIAALEGQVGDLQRRVEQLEAEEEGAAGTVPEGNGPTEAASRQPPKMLDAAAIYAKMAGRPVTSGPAVFASIDSGAIYARYRQRAVKQH